MADVTDVFSKFKGTRCMAFEADCGAAADTISSAQLLSVAPTSGAVFNFLNATYANAAAVENAFLAAGGILSCNTRAGTTVITNAGWTNTGASTKPIIQLAAGDATSFAEITILLPHSIAQ